MNSDTAAVAKDSGNKSNKKAIILTVIGFAVVVSVMFLMRLFVFNGDMIYAINEGRTDQYYIPAYIGENGAVYFNYFSVRDVYLTLLSCFFKFYGNVESCIFYYDLVLEFAALLFLFFATKRIFGRIASFVISLIAASYPAFILLSGILTGAAHVLLWRDDRIIYLAGCFALWILSFIIGGVKKSIKKKKASADTEETSSDVSDPADSSSEEEDTGKHTENLTDDVKETEKVKEQAKSNSDSSDDLYGGGVDVVLSDDGMLIDEVKDNKDDGLLISPLPGPQKHVHKELDYDYEIDVDMMKYDIDVDDNAEFDHE